MGRGRRGLVPAAASGPKERHKRSQRAQYHPYSPPPDTFKAKPSLPKSKHHSYFELVENKEKKKKLEYQVTTEKTPPPGFEFIPIGNPQLTAACKEISREKDAMIFIVSNAKSLDETILSNQVHRVGHHIRQVIVEEAKESLGGSSHHAVPVTNAGPEPIPESQRVYHAQVDAALRDLFPRIPNTDRQMIIEHSFTRGSANRSEHPVGFSEDIALSRRVQLAVLAHIRHTHTRYDLLLKETTWQNARKTVESLCLDILVKWRGDEETGRDQLDEILREVVVISDSEDDEDDNDDDEEDSTDYTSDEGADNARLTPMPVYRSAPPPLQLLDRTDRFPPRSPIREVIPVASSPPPIRFGLEDIDRARRDDRRAQRGFRRYRAWEEAIRRNRGETPLVERPSPDIAISHASFRPSPPARFSYDAYGRPFDDPDPMAHPGGIFGVSSHLDDHRMQQPAYGIPSSLNSSPYLGRTAEAQSAHEKVMSVVPFPTSTSSRELASSSASSHFQDMLVRSIESRSPTAQPTFIRTLPPRSQASVSSYAPPAPPLAGIQQSPQLVSYPGEEIRSWDRHQPMHVSTGFDTSQVMSIDDPLSSRESIQSLDFRGSTYFHPPSGYGTTQPGPPFPYPAPSNPGSGSSRLPESRRIVLQATRPGERPNPILMEDRGGYFERVNPRPESSSRIQLRPVRPTQPQTEVENHRIVRPHTIFSWEEDVRNRRGRRGVAEIEVNPIIDPRPHAPHFRQYAAPHEYFGALPPGKEDDYRVQSWRAPDGEYGAAPPEGYWTIRQHGDEQVSRAHHEPATHHPMSTLPPRAEEQYEPGRDHRPLAQPAPNVIIID